jgi:hypothetical protein
MKPRKHIYVKYCWQTYFKSIGTLSQIFKNHINVKNVGPVAKIWSERIEGLSTRICRQFA